MEIEIFSSIDDICARQWDGLAGDYPFLRHGFLAAMERHGGVGASVGWRPRHLGCFDAVGGRRVLVGAMPVYEKHHSWGEFVFDQAWAHAFFRAGLDYYPKLVNAIPHTPATGARFLAAAGRRAEIAAALVEALRDCVAGGRHGGAGGGGHSGDSGDESGGGHSGDSGGGHGASGAGHGGGYSGAHCLFAHAEDVALLNRRGAVSRFDCHFRWRNRGYGDFADFLGALKAKKRKNIRRERAAVAAAGVVFRRLDGHTAKPEDWQHFTAMYGRIYEQKHGQPAFNCGFFRAVAAAIPMQVQLVMAHHGDAGEPVAAALMFVDGNTLYGRHWGCARRIDCLHFEACYYQGIEICIARGLDYFDPGVQGEHKIARGFEAVRTHSLHWMAPNPFAAAIGQFAAAEKTHIEAYMAEVARHSPYQHCAT